MMYHQTSYETIWPQALSDHQTHDSDNLVQILGHSALLGEEHSAPGHRMELYQSQLVRLMDAAAVAGSAHSANPEWTQQSLGDISGPHSGTVTLVIFTSQHEHNFQNYML
jgi:hypothetical protein